MSLSLFFSEASEEAQRQTERYNVVRHALCIALNKDKFISDEKREQMEPIMQFQTISTDLLCLMETYIFELFGQSVAEFALANESVDISTTTSALRPEIYASRYLGDPKKEAHKISKTELPPVRDFCVILSR